MNYEVGILESEYTSSFADGLQTMMGLAQIPRISCMSFVRETMPISGF